MLDCTAIAVEELIPHSPPMVLLDRILKYDNMSLVAEVFISPDSRFFEPSFEGVPAWVGIEYMAQAISALAGLRAREKHQAIKLGFLLGTRKLQLQHKVLHSGNCYHIYVKQLFWDESGLASFECEIRQQDEVCVAARINVFETDDVKQVVGDGND